jgi:hypothetical protein
MFQGIFKGLFFTAFFVGGAFALRFYFDREFIGENGWWIDYAISFGIVFFFYFSLYMVRNSIAHREDIDKECNPLTNGNYENGKIPEYEDYILCPLVKWTYNGGLIGRVFGAFLLSSPVFLVTFLEWYNGQEEFTLEIVIFTNIYFFLTTLLLPKFAGSVWGYLIALPLYTVAFVFYTGYAIFVGLKDFATGKNDIKDVLEEIAAKRDLYKKIKDNK